MRTVESRIRSVMFAQPTYADVIGKVEGIVGEIMRAGNDRVMNLHVSRNGNGLSECRLSVNEVYFGEELADMMENDRWWSGEDKPDENLVKTSLVRRAVLQYINRNI